jgi:nucleoside-diphosphate-sugar epimerase
MAADERFLVTGSKGCIGAWTVRLLLDEGTPVVGFDLDADPGRLRLLASDEEVERVRFVAGDITDTATMARVVVDEGITHIVHLAGLQAPFCRADPVRGAQVNVVGTVNVFEAAQANREQVRGLAYASSAAVFGPSRLYPDGIARDDSPLAPSATIYGVYKQANEWTAKVYAETQGLGSVGLRPFIVYGPGRDQGITSTPTIALVAAAARRPYRISFGGHGVYQYAEDVARIFIRSARARPEHAYGLNIGGDSTSMADWVAAIEAAAPEAAGMITYEDVVLPFVSAVDSSGLTRLLGHVDDVPVEEGIRRSIAKFHDLLDRGLVQAPSTDV